MQYITEPGLKKVKTELQECKTTKRQEIAQRLEEAKSLGDLSENAEYTSAKDDQAFNEGRVLELEEIIKNAQVIDPEKQKSLNGSSQIQIGSIIEVKLENKGSGDKQDFIIVSPQEAAPSEGKISNESPLGKAFIGNKKGDIIEVETPGGRLRYKILNVK